MYIKLRLILSEVLRITQYPHDSALFIEKFLQQCRQIAILQLIETLSADKQSELKTHLKNVTSGNQGKQLILSFFTTAQYNQTLDYVAITQFKEYVSDIINTLSPIVNKQLKAYIKTLTPFFSDKY